MQKYKNSLTTSPTVIYSQKMYERFGSSLEAVSNNGPAFDSKEFAIKLSKIEPYQAGQATKIIKNALHKT